MRAKALLILSCVLTLAACASNDGGGNDELEAISASRFQQVEIGMTKDEVRSLLDKPSRVRMIENRHEAFRASTGVTLETVYEVWDYRAEDGAYYRLLFDNTDRVGTKFR